MSLRRVRNWCRLSPQESRLIDCRILLGRKGENSYDLTQPEMGSVAKATHWVLTKVCSECCTYTFNYSPVWARGHWRQRYKQATQGTELEQQNHSETWATYPQHLISPLSPSKDGNKWPSVDGIPVWTWTSPPRKKVWCCLPQSNSPAKRADSGHSGNPKRSTWGKRSNRVFEDPIIDPSKGISSYLYIGRFQQDTGFVVLLNSVSSVSFRILSLCSSGKFAYDFLFIISLTVFGIRVTLLFIFWNSLEGIAISSLKVWRVDQWPSHEQVHDVHVWKYYPGCHNNVYTNWKRILRMGLSAAVIPGFTTETVMTSLQ